jgi:hypothetical protein
VIRYHQFHVFLSTGIGVGTLDVDHPQGNSVFPDLNPWEGKRVEFEAWEVPFEIGTDYFVPFGRASTSEKWLLQWGVRAGWIEQISRGGWQTTEKSPRDLVGPPVDLSGMRARLVLGFGVQNGW